MRTALLSAVMALVAMPAWAADERRADNVSDQVFKTPDLIGKTVKNKGGDYIGYLEDMVVDIRNGRITYAVLTHKENVGFGGAMFALPLQAFQMAGDLSHLLLDCNKDEFDNASGFDANKWPTQADERWMKRFNVTPNREGIAPEGKRGDNKGDSKGTEDKYAHLRRITSLNGLPLKGSDGQRLGTIAGFAVDVKNANVVYAAMAYGGVVGVGTKYFALPWRSLELTSLSLRVQDRTFVVHATKADFDNQPGFDRNSWPTKGDDRFMKTRKEK